MRKIAFTIAGVAVTAVLGFYIGYFYAWQTLDGRVTTMLFSPDESMRAVLVEKRSFIDRNFEIRLEWWGSGGATSRTIIFSSPDEGRPVGTERFLWSRDSGKLLLVGKHFFTADDARLPTGEYLYFLYDVATGTKRCNASQGGLYPPFTLSDTAGIGLVEPLPRNVPTASPD